MLWLGSNGGCWETAVRCTILSTVGYGPSSSIVPGIVARGGKRTVASDASRVRRQAWNQHSAAHKTG